jgi:hypothetical protein
MLPRSITIDMVDETTLNQQIPPWIMWSKAMPPRGKHTPKSVVIARSGRPTSRVFPKKSWPKAVDHRNEQCNDAQGCSHGRLWHIRPLLSQAESSASITRRSLRGCVVCRQSARRGHHVFRHIAAEATMLWHTTVPLPYPKASSRTKTFGHGAERRPRRCRRRPCLAWTRCMAIIREVVKGEGEGLEAMKF